MGWRSGIATLILAGGLAPAALLPSIGHGEEPSIATNSDQQARDDRINAEIRRRREEYRREFMAADPDLGLDIRKGAVLDRTLWLLGGGAVVTFGLDDGSRTVVVQRGAIDLERQGSVLWVLHRRNLKTSRRIRSRWGPSEIVVSKWDGGRFEDLPAIAGMDGKVFAIQVREGHPYVFTTRSILRWTGQAWTEVVFRGQFRSGFIRAGTRRDSSIAFIDRDGESGSIRTGVQQDGRFAFIGVSAANLAAASIASISRRASWRPSKSESAPASAPGP